MQWPVSHQPALFNMLLLFISVHIIADYYEHLISPHGYSKTGAVATQSARYAQSALEKLSKTGDLTEAFVETTDDDTPLKRLATLWLDPLSKNFQPKTVISYIQQFQMFLRYLTANRPHQIRKAKSNEASVTRIIDGMRPWLSSQRKSARKREVQLREKEEGKHFFIYV